MSERREGSPDLVERRPERGGLPGDRYVRIVRPYKGAFTRRGPGHLVAREEVLAPTTPLGRLVDVARRVLFGARIPTEREIHERIGIFKGLAVFASDNISSSAYATEEIMRVLVLAGVASLTLTMPITIVIVVVLAIVVASYQQTIRAYPNGVARTSSRATTLAPRPA